MPRRRNNAAPQQEQAPAAEAQEQATPQITVQVAAMGNRQTLRVAPGETVSQAMQRAGITANRSTTMVRGRQVAGDTVLEDGDVLVVSSQVRAG